MAKFFKCKDCEDREPGCHGRCEKYKKSQEEWQKAKDYVRAEEDYYTYKIQSIIRYQEKKRRKLKED